MGWTGFLLVLFRLGLQFCFIYLTLVIQDLRVARELAVF